MIFLQAIWRHSFPACRTGYVENVAITHLMLSLLIEGWEEKILVLLSMKDICFLEVG